MTKPQVLIKWSHFIKLSLVVFRGGLPASLLTCRNTINWLLDSGSQRTPPPPISPPFPSTKADITMEARRGLLICSQLQPHRALHGKVFKLFWNWDDQPEASRKQISDKAHCLRDRQGVNSCVIIQWHCLKLKHYQVVEDISEGSIEDVEMQGVLIVKERSGHAATY